MIVVIYPTGTQRSVHTRHFAAEAELIDADIKFINTKQFLSIPMPQWEPDTIFLIRVGAVDVVEILHVLHQYYSKGYTIFPNVPAIKHCLEKGGFSDLCKQNDIKTPETTYFSKTDEKHWKHFPFWEWGQCVIKPSQGSLGDGIYCVEGTDVVGRIEQIIKTQDEFYEYCDIIVQQRIVNKKNIPESIRVFCFMGEPTCSITLTNSVLDTVSNLHKGGVAGPYFPDDNLKEQCRKICKATGIEFTAIDFIQDQQGNYYCLETNVAPHVYTAFGIYGGKINHPKMIFNYLLDKSKKDSIIL